MFQWIADENGEAAVGRVSSEWSSGKLKLRCLCIQKKCVCVPSSLFGLIDFVHRSWTSGGSWEFARRSLQRIILLLVPCVSE